MAARVSNEIEQKVIKLYREKESCENIARTLGISTLTVRRIRDRNGIPRNPRNHIGKHHPRWKGGRRIGKGGYVIVWVDPNDSLGQATKKASSNEIFEHRLVMAHKLGRALRSSESVHHINGDRQDNRPENLEIREHKHGPGIKMRCRNCGSSDFEPIQILRSQKDD